MTGPEQLMDAIGQLPEDLIVPVAELRRKGPKVRKWMAIAACLILMLGLGLSAVLSSPAVIEQEPTEQTAQSGFVLTVKVEQVQEDRLLVRQEFDFGEMAYSPPLWVMLADLENPPELKVGDRILVYYNGLFRDGCIDVVYYIEKLE